MAGKSTRRRKSNRVSNTDIVAAVVHLSDRLKKVERKVRRLRGEPVQPGDMIGFRIDQGDTEYEVVPDEV